MSPPSRRSSRRRVALIVPGFSADPTDWCIPALRNFVEELARHDDVWVLALRYPPVPCRYRVFGADVCALGGGIRRMLGSATLWARAFAALAAEHRSRPFDLVHAFWADEAGAIAAITGRLLGVPSLVSLAGGEVVGLPDLGYGSQLARAQRLKVWVALQLATAISAGSSHQLRLAQPLLRRRPTTPRLRLPLGVDRRLFNPNPVDPGDPRTPGNHNQMVPRLIQVASLVPVKGQATLLHAAHIARAAGARFTLDVVGDGPLRPFLQELAVGLGIDDIARFVGPVPHHDLPRWYHAAYAFVLSSRHEAQCLAILEAAACGAPAVGTRVGLLPEIDPVAAIGVATGRSTVVTDLGEAIAGLLGDRDRRDSLSRAASELVTLDYDVSWCVEAFRRVYADLNDSSSR